MEDNKLFSEFPPVSTEKWEEVINKDLKGADYEKKLVWKTIEGFKVRPYYRAENLEGLEYLDANPGEKPYTRGKHVADNVWEVRQDIHVKDLAEANRIADQVLINKRSREAAERARTVTKGKLSGKVDIANRIQKFVDCRSRDAQQRELYIVEGDSALGACKLSRDAEFQGIMPVRGKILSAFDLRNLRWNKIIICTDADVDGYQIRTLILTMLYRLVPTLIDEGFVYIAESPLYEINAKGKTWFAYTEREKAEILSGLKNTKVSINRSKGLGENDPDMMWMTTMNPQTRRLIKVMPEDAQRMAEMFDLLLGDNLEGRKNYIAQFGSNFLDQADLS